MLRNNTNKKVNITLQSVNKYVKNTIVSYINILFTYTLTTQCLKNLIMFYYYHIKQLYCVLHKIDINLY